LIQCSRHFCRRTSTDPHSCYVWPLYSIGKHHESSHKTSRAAIVSLISSPLKKPASCIFPPSTPKCFLTLCRAWSSVYSLREGYKMNRDTHCLAICTRPFIIFTGFHTATATGRYSRFYPETWQVQISLGLRRGAVRPLFHILLLLFLSVFFPSATAAPFFLSIVLPASCILSCLFLCSTARTSCITIDGATLLHDTICFKSRVCFGPPHAIIRH
jgi:hypothetical protein